MSSFFGRGRKSDMMCLATEIGLSVNDDLKIVELKKAIMESSEYIDDADYIKELYQSIVNERMEKEALQKEERDRAFELEKMQLELSSTGTTANTESRNSGTTYRMDLHKVLPQFNPKDGDICWFLVSFERQAKMMKIPKEFWVGHLISVLPSEIINMISRESEERATDYDQVKALLLKRFKLSPEKFRQLFNKHQKAPESTWRDFYHQLQNYLEEWLAGLEVKTYDQLKDLMLVEQLKKRVPADVREHYLDDWASVVSPMEFAEKIEEYEEVRGNFKPKFTPPAPDKVKKGWRTNVSHRDRFGKSDKPRNLDTKARVLPSRTETSAANRKPVCYTCGVEGHISRFCPSRNAPDGISSTSSRTNSVQTTVATEIEPEILTARVTTSAYQPNDRKTGVDELRMVDIKCNNVSFKGVIDTGAQISVVREDLVDGCQGEGEGTIKIVSAFGDSEVTPLKIFHMKIDDRLHGAVPITCAVSRKLVSDMLICQTAYEALCDNVYLHGMQERPIVTNACIADSINEGETAELSAESHETRKSFIELQRSDESLRKAWEHAQNGQCSYEIQDGVLLHSENVCGEVVKQVVLPECKHLGVLKMAHEIPLAGHLGEKKTVQRIKYTFYWPSIKRDVKKFCSSCKPCQLRRAASYRDRIPIQPIARPEVPFEVWSVDCIGPLEPTSGRGHKFIICAVDLCTRWAEAIAVRNITAKTTCDVLMKIFAQTGFPKVICTDQGPNFTADLTDQFLSVLGVSPRFATPGHPESMGAVERWNKTLKEMLNKNIQEHGRKWDLHLPYLLFAYREVPHSTTGVSPFQLVYGRLPPGPLSILKDVWLGEKEIPTGTSRPVDVYLRDLVERLQKAHEIATETSEMTQREYTSRYNLRSRDKCFSVGDKVLMLIPSSSHKLLNTWSGPATIIEISRPHSAIVELDDGSTRELHFNKLRPFIARVEHVGLIFDQDEDFGELYYTPSGKVEKGTEDLRDHLNTQGTLQNQQRLDLLKVLNAYRDVFNSKPGQAKLEGHSVRVTSECSPKRLRPYRVPIALQDEVDRQIRDLLESGLIEPSDSEWSHPVVCVSKKNGSVRLCVDFRYLNSFTVPDAFPMQVAKELLYKVGKAQFITVLDLTKGYWQIPMKEEAKKFTGFVTHSGHYQWKVMPFGMKNAGSTFQRSMNKILAPHRKFCEAYIDDVAVYSETWSEHLDHIRQVFRTLRDVGLTVNLEKCEFGKKQVKFLGHVIGSGIHSPDPQKVEAIRNMPRPITKKEVRSIMGLASYYRDYIKNFAAIVLPLTNLTKKSVPNCIPWEREAEEAFQKLKDELVRMPSLYTPNLNKPFQLYTDASAYAIGACLAQKDEMGREKPIAFFSKKLSATQMRWATIEREAYCVLESLKKFDTWIFASEIEVVSDHNPLQYLTQSVPHGAKLTRWALALQRYNVTVSYRKGSKHGNADALSRLPPSE